MKRRAFIVIMAAAFCAAGIASSLAVTSPRSQAATAATRCVVRRLLPDARCTRGTISATRAIVCRSGYTGRVRNVPLSVKAAVYAEYGIANHRSSEYEIDHLIPAELGASNAIGNLWPEAEPGFCWKDVLEKALHRKVCAGRIALPVAQRLIARNWVGA